MLGWSASETAALLEISVAAANSALQRGRETLRRELPAERLDWGPAVDPTEDERALLERYIDAHDRGDPAAVAALLRDDARFTMPPQPTLCIGRDAIADFFARHAFGAGALRLIATRANRQPAAANYVRAPGDDAYRAMSLDVLRIERGAIAEITTFEPRFFAGLGLPASL